MNQVKRRHFLIRELLDEESRYHNIDIPADEEEQKQLLRALMNIRAPKKVQPAFLAVQDAYLKEEIDGKGITDIDDLKPLSEGIYLWKGDITTLRCGAIVNAANSGMTGCYVPNHGCIDNAIHSFAGIQLRLACADMMKKQGYDEPTGRAKITKGYNLPCNYILHTVGPIIRGKLTIEDCELLADCYRSCLELAARKKVNSVAFCCISTGEFHFPNEKAAEIAVQTIKSYQQEKTSIQKVVFNVFKEEDKRIYERLLGADQ